MEAAGEGAERGDTERKLGNILRVETEETKEGIEVGAGVGAGPVADKVELGAGGAIAVFGQIMTDPFETG